MTSTMAIIPPVTADVIATVAAEVAHELRSDWWPSAPPAYDLADRPDDADLLSGVLARPATPAERDAFERCVRVCLGAP